MHKNRKKLRKRAKLPEGLEKRLAAYALSAAAAGAGMLAMAAPAQANDIVVVPVSPPIMRGTNGSIVFLTNSTSSALKLLAIRAFTYSSVSGGVDGKLIGYGFNGGGFMVNGSSQAALLAKGSLIGGPSASFGATATLAGNLGSSIFGNWANQSGYLGFKIFSSGHSYLGWMHLKVTASTNGETVSLSSFAYDIRPGETLTAGQVTTPEPSTLALLAMGAVGLFALRRKKRAVAN